MKQQSSIRARSSGHGHQTLGPVATLAPVVAACASAVSALASAVAARASAVATPVLAITALAFATAALTSTASVAAEPRKAPAEAIAALAQNPTVPAAGAKDADVTIVEFFDYNCPFCKKTAPELQKFLHTDAKVRVLYKEWPIFGDVSEYAARSALAAHWQGKFLVAHDVLIASPTDLDENSQVDALLKKAGLDMTKLSHDRATHAAEITTILARNSKEAASLGFKGTPAFVIGRQLIPQSLTVQTFQQLTQSARQSP